MQLDKEINQDEKIGKDEITLSLYDHMWHEKTKGIRWNTVESNIKIQKLWKVENLYIYIYLNSLYDGKVSI